MRVFFTKYIKPIVTAICLAATLTSILLLNPVGGNQLREAAAVARTSTDATVTLTIATTHTTTSAPTVPSTTARPTTTTRAANYTECDNIVFASEALTVHYGSYSAAQTAYSAKRGFALNQIAIGDNGWSKIRLRDGSTGYAKTSLLESECRVTNDFSYSFSDMNIVDASYTNYTYIRMSRELRNLAAAYPEHLTYEPIGITADGRDIYCATLGNPEAEKSIFVQASIHGCESMNTELVMKQLEYYLRYYETGSVNGQLFKNIFDRVCVYIVPMANPDGVTLSQLGINGIRSAELQSHIRSIYDADVTAKFTTRSFESYLSHWKANARGVDLNRNYEIGFRVNAKRADYSFSEYSGENPASELETIALSEFVGSHSSIAATMSLHSMGNMLFWECEQSGSFRQRCLSYVNLIEKMTGYRKLGRDPEPYMGSFADFVISKEIPNVTVETGAYNTPLYKYEFLYIWNETQNIIAATAQHFS